MVHYYYVLYHHLWCNAESFWFGNSCTGDSYMFYMWCIIDVFGVSVSYAFFMSPPLSQKSNIRKINFWSFEINYSWPVTPHNFILKTGGLKKKKKLWIVFHRIQLYYKRDGNSVKKNLSALSYVLLFLSSWALRIEKRNIEADVAG